MKAEVDPSGKGPHGEQPEAGGKNLAEQAAAAMAQASPLPSVPAFKPISISSELTRTAAMDSPSTPPIPQKQSPPEIKVEITDEMIATAVSKAIDPQVVTKSIEHYLENHLQGALVKALEGGLKENLEKAIWKLVPDMATQLIKDEITRLTDAES